MKILMISAVSCLLLFISCKGEQKQTGNTDYATMKIALGSKTLENNYSATIQGKQNVEIRPQVSGCITQICIREGSEVKMGQTLFVIDQVPYQAALQTATANVKSAEAKLATARISKDSKEVLYKENIVSEFDLQTARNALLEAEAVVAQAKAQETNARNDLSYTIVKSPVDGVASMIPYRVGALVSSAISEPLVTVSDDSEVYAYFSMTENQVLNLLQKGGSLEEFIKETPEVSLKLSNGTLFSHKGRIDAISGTIDTKTGSINVRATYPNKESLLRNGSSGQVIIPVVYEQCMVIPQNATYELQNKVFVYKVIDGKASSTPVQVSEINNGKEYIVESGLQPGDVIVSEGAGLMREGTVIAVHEEMNAE